MNDDAINAAIDLLRAAGYRVSRTEEGPWTTPALVRAQFGLSSEQLSYRLGHRHAPAFSAERGPSGRLLRLRLNPALREWLTLRPSAGRPFLSQS
jgi:hypothetical protein